MSEFHWMKENNTLLTDKNNASVFAVTLYGESDFNASIANVVKIRFIILSSYKFVFFIKIKSCAKIKF